MSSVLASAAIEFLRQHAPFNDMDAGSLALIAARARLSYHPAGTLVVGPGSGPAGVLYLLQRGTVRARFTSGPALFDELVFAPGEPFPISAVVGRRATTAEYRATEDSFTYEIDGSTVEELMLRSPVFRRYCTAQVESLLQQAYRRMRESYDDEGEHERTMLTPLAEILRLAPVTCTPGTPLKEALELMQRFQVGSVVVVSEQAAPLGIFTERDLLRHSAEGRADLAAPIERFMTRDPLGLPATASVHEAALLMARRGIRHLLVLDAGRVKSVVSERSLFAHERLSMLAASHAIELARDAEGLKDAADAIRRFAASMLVQGVGAEPLTQIISALNDRLTESIVALEAANHDLGGLPWCWLALGSEGRGEQTIATDQDNAIVFEAGDDAAQARLLDFARAQCDARRVRISAVQRRDHGGQPAELPLFGTVAHPLRLLAACTDAAGAARGEHLFRFPAARGRGRPRRGSARVDRARYSRERNVSASHGRERARQRPSDRFFRQSRIGSGRRRYQSENPGHPGVCGCRTGVRSRHRNDHHAHGDAPARSRPRAQRSGRRGRIERGGVLLLAARAAAPPAGGCSGRRRGEPR